MGDRQSQKGGASKAPVQNPYARKKTSNARNATNQNRAPIPAANTFSQVFGDDDIIEASVPQPGRQKRSAALEQGLNATNSLSTTQTNSGNSALANNTNTVTVNHIDMIQPHVLHVSVKQRGNGVLRYIRNVPFEYSKIVPDFMMAPNRCCLFISMKYHNLHPNYIFRRIAELNHDFDLRVLLCLVDMEDNASTLLFLNKICVVNSMTLILAWSEKEAARYLETFKAYEGKDVSALQKKKEETFEEQVSECLQTVLSVNKSDSAALISQFTNLKSIVTAPIDELTLCPGIGDKKVRRLYDAFHKPFSSKRKSSEKPKPAGSSLDNNDSSIINVDIDKPEKLKGTEEQSTSSVIVIDNDGMLDSKAKSIGE